MILEEATVTAAELNSLPPTLFFHARGTMAKGMAKGHFKLLSALADHATGQGLSVRLLPHARLSHEVAVTEARHLHVFLEDRPFYGRNIFHATPGYLRGFWFFDQIGSRNNATQRLAKFSDSAVPTLQSQTFFTQIAGPVRSENRSKFTQPPLGETAISPGSIAFFAQDFKPPRHHTHFMTVPEMIEATIAAKGKRALYIKPHPNQSLAELEILASYDAPENGVHVVMASIHDLLAACDLVVTVTSAVGFEAFLHRKPVVLGGQTDFWQNAITLTDPAKMADAIAAALGQQWPYEAFLYWYLHIYCIEDHPRALPRILAALHQRGYALGDVAGQGFFTAAS